MLDAGRTVRTLTTETYQKTGTETEPVLLQWSLRRPEPSMFHLLGAGGQSLPCRRFRHLR